MTKKRKLSINEISYKLQTDHLEKYVTDKEKNKHAETWMNEETVDAWRHTRLRNLIKPILNCYQKASWLTVGDGRYGSDAHFIEQEGGNVMATDISDALLKIGKDKGFIKKFKRENAEKLSFNDESFDFVFCKESYHHFPRPIISLYEMFRVAREGVILIEPNDTRSVTKRYKYNNAYEKSGNYVYTISEREIEKVALGMQLNTLAFKEIDNYYINGVEYENFSNKSLLFKRIRFMLLLLEVLYRLRLRHRNLLCAIVFKTKPKSKLIKELKAQKFRVINLPKNPYMKEK